MTERDRERRRRRPRRPRRNPIPLVQPGQPYYVLEGTIDDSWLHGDPIDWAPTLERAKRAATDDGPEKPTRLPVQRNAGWSEPREEDATILPFPSRRRSEDDDPDPDGEEGDTSL